MKAIAIAALLSCVGTDCVAQSLEETALYVLTGLVDGAVAIDKTSTVKRVAPDRFAFRLADGTFDKRELLVVMKNSCQIEAYVDRTGEEKFLMFGADFSKIGDVVVTAKEIRFKGDEDSVCGGDVISGKCVATTSLPLMTAIDKDRHQKAYRHYRDKYCRGRAF